MKYRVFCASLLCAFSYGANAESPLDSVMLFLTQKSMGAVWTSEKTAHIKSFDALLFNGGKKEIDLGSVCYKAYDAKGNSYRLDATDENMTKGLLKPGKSVKGFYEFLSEDEGIYSASVVKVLLDCK
ncbi:DUF4354 family protein [Pseudomonas sp. A34-9]|uniref:DUF4354 family protein n=1 Tax=Pseudomonas sp. A34-9 TaxID=3034675 RepID=UPI00240D15A0|nr:DUF4354 family protein [Pseudomonas sp. A34-9]